MIHTLSGTVELKTGHYVVINVGGVGFRVATPTGTAASLRQGEQAKLYTHLHVREDLLDLYGFPDEDTLIMFEQLLSVNGVGPKSALAILDIASLNTLKSAVKEGRPDLLTQAAGIGRKTAERVVLELRGKVVAGGSAAVVEAMQGDADLVETLAGLGYKKDQAKAALEKVDRSVTEVRERLKLALAVLSGKKK